MPNKFFQMMIRRVSETYCSLEESGNSNYSGGCGGNTALQTYKFCWWIHYKFLGDSLLGHDKS